MRRLALAGCLLACAEWRSPPTFPRQAAGRPVIHEQAVLGISDVGDLAVAQLLEADGQEPRLSLLRFDRGGGPTRTLFEAPPERARVVAGRFRGSGHQPAPLLAGLVAAEWPDALAKAAELGYARRPPRESEPGRARWRVNGARGAGALPLNLRLSEVTRPAPAMALLLSDEADEIELARMPLAGAAVRPELWIQGGIVWLLAGSVLPGEPLHRAVGVRRGSLARGEAELHNLHGFADYSAGELDAARREFARAIAADPLYVEALYNAASTEALADHAEEAVALLRRAAAVDPARVQVLGRNDEDFKALRRRPDVRALLGLHRLPPEGVPPPP
jgi:tetratricopeptide (TPR) repeat protein